MPGTHSELLLLETPRGLNFNAMPYLGSNGDLRRRRSELICALSSAASDPPRWGHLWSASLRIGTGETVRAHLTGGSFKVNISDCPFEIQMRVEIIRPSPKKALILPNLNCVYCGDPLNKSSTTEEHVIGRKFVPKNSLFGQWNLIVNAWRKCNNI